MKKNQAYRNWLLLFFLVTIAVNVFLTWRIARLASDVERLDAAYADVLESLRDTTDWLQSLPALPILPESGQNK